MSTPLDARPAPEAGRISTGQFAWMLFAVFTSGTSTTIPRLLLNSSGRDAWLTVLVAGALDLAISLVFIALGRRFPGQTMVQYASSALGPWVGKPLGLLYPLFFFLVGALELRSIADLMGTVFLRGTPQTVIALMVLAAAAYAARHGLEVTARVAQVLGPVFVISVTMIAIIVSPLIRTERIHPILENGLGPVWRGVPFTYSFIGVCIMMGMFMAYKRQPRRTFQGKLYAIAGGAVMLGLILFLAVTVVGTDLSRESRYPDLEVVRMISVSDFLERLEVIWVVVSLGASVLALAILLWASALGIAQSFGLRSDKPLVLPLAGVMLPMAILLFPNITDQGEFIRLDFPLFALTVELGLVLIIWLGAWLTGRRGIAPWHGVEE